MTIAAEHCPSWAFNPRDRSSRHQRTNGDQQPIWRPVNGRAPMAGFETFVADILTNLRVTWVYEALTVPLNRHSVCNDFFLPDYNMLIEIYSGYNEHTKNRKHYYLERISYLYGASFLLLIPSNWDQLKADPNLLATWIAQAWRTR